MGRSKGPLMPAALLVGREKPCNWAHHLEALTACIRCASFTEHNDVKKAAWWQHVLHGWSCLRH
jgi:hypothetical protein